MKKKCVIFTSVTGTYDDIPWYDVVDDEFDYVCFNNDYPDGSTQGIWTIKKIPYVTNDNAVLSRYVKLLPNHILKEYEYSLWMDACLIIRTTDFYDYVKKRIREGGLWYGVIHPERDCIYSDAIECVKYNKSGFIETRKHMNFLKKEGYPSHYGLFENNIILRKQNDFTVQAINEQWWTLFKIHSTHRDQLSLFFIFWKMNFSPDSLLGKNMHSGNIDMLYRKDHNIPRTIISRFNEVLHRLLFKMFERFISKQLLPN